ncbi:MAG: exonuclease domain-containing protein [Myxococcota bacterium]
MKALIFDTETTGMVEFKKPPEDKSQPDLIQLGMLLVDTVDWKPRARSAFLVTLAEGVKIDPAAKAAHGISEEDCARFGVPASIACSFFNQACLQADVVVAHNSARRLDHEDRALPPRQQALSPRRPPARLHEGGLDRTC